LRITGGDRAVDSAREQRREKSKNSQPQSPDLNAGCPASKAQARGAAAKPRTAPGKKQKTKPSKPSPSAWRPTSKAQAQAPRRSREQRRAKNKKTKPSKPNPSA